VSGAVASAQTVGTDRPELGETELIGGSPKLCGGDSGMSNARQPRRHPRETRMAAPDNVRLS